MRICDNFGICCLLQISRLITQVSELQGSNQRLNRSLEEAMDRYDLLANQHTDLKTTLDSTLVELLVMAVDMNLISKI